MTLSIQMLDYHQAHALLASQLSGQGAVRALDTALIADHIRTLVWAPYLRAFESNPRRVHTSRIFAALDRNVRFLSQEISVSASNDELHSEYEFVRDQLERCGDVVHVGNGYWIPGPVRVLQVAGSQTAIVLGGTPTSALQQMLNVQVHSVGPARYVPEAASVSYPRASIADWLGITETLSDWTEKVLSWGASQLQPQAEIEDDSIEIYAPDLFRARRRPGFWMQTKEFQETAPILRLFRPKAGSRSAFDRPDYLGVFTSQPEGTRLTRSIQIPKDTAYRLQFGFDQKLATPRTIGLRRAHDAHSLDLKFALPGPERRVLGLAWREPGHDSEYLFDEFALPALNEVMTTLGIRVLQT